LVGKEFEIKCPPSFKMIPAKDHFLFASKIEILLI